MKMARTLSTVLLSLYLVVVLLSPAVVSEKKRCHPEDKKVLLQIKKDLNDPYVLASWDPKTDCCDWYCVACDERTNRIITIRINLDVPETNFSAQIPPSVALVPNLENLVLNNLPYLTGPLPPAIAKIPNLKFISISNTNLSGPIPTFLGRLKKLTFIELSRNNLTGTIPGELSQLPKLEVLYLDHNHLTGTIPPSFGSFKSIVNMYLSHNSLSGPIPPSFFNLKITRLDLSWNKLEGDASGLFVPNKVLETIDLSRNQLAFDVSKLKFSPKIIYLDLNHNKLYGSLPKGLTALDLQTFNVSYNMLCGQIPVGGRLQQQDISSYFHNKCLCGSPLPSCK